MEQLIATIEKGQPFFNAIARNKYLKAIRDGFISVIPIIIFSSIFCLVASVPNIWGFYWPDDINNALWKCYNYSMGILAIACAATTAKHFADAQNRDLPKNNQINFISCMCAAIIGFLLLSSDTIATDAASGFNTTYLGSKGLLTAFIAAFVTGIIYKFFIKRNITVKMPEQVPPNISQTFKDIIPFSVCITVFWVFDIVFRAAFGFCFAQGVIQVFQPLFTAADGYIGLAVIYGAMSLFWFVGVHGPSIVEPAIAAALVANMTDNLAAFQAGQHASAVLTQGAQYFVVCMGGTGATLVLVFMFCFLAKSQEMRAVGKAAIVPVCFAVNEPLLFAAPIVLNPVFFVPFVFAPIANIWILKIFIDFLGMNGFMYTLPWTVPGPIGTIMGLGFQPLAFVMLAIILVVDFALYYPFFRAYDAQKCAEEAEISQEELAAKNAEKAAKLNDAFQGKADAKSVAAGAAADAVKADAPAASAAPAAEATTASDLNGKRVLVLCQGGGTSGLLANALAKAAKERGINLTAETSTQEQAQVQDNAELSKPAAEPQPASQQIQSEVAQWEDDHVQDISASVQTVKAHVEQETPSPENQVPPASMLPDAPEQVLDEYPMPDEVLQASDLEACGYMDGDMLPLSKERALELYDMDLTVYAIVSGGSAEMLFDQEEFETQAPGTVFAVSREEWEQSPMFHEKIIERQQHQEEREAAFLTHTGDCFALYQVCREDPNNVRFMNMDWMQSHGLAIERGNYDLIYTGQLTEKGTTEQKLEMLYETFNLHHPADYHSPSLSVSDIVAVKQNGVVSCHYCDSVGFQELPSFLPPDNPLKNAEMAVEDDYGMIDGIINNGPRQTVAELEQQARSGQPISLMDLAEAVHQENREKKKSVMEQLHSQPKQGHKKTAPKKSAEREI